MASSHPEFLKSGAITESGRRGKAIQESQNHDLIPELDKIAEIRWNPANAFATLIPKAGRNIAIPQVPIHAVFQTFGEEETKLRNFIPLLISGEATRIDTVVSIADPGKEKSLYEICCWTDSDAETKPIIIFTLSRQFSQSDKLKAVPEESLPVGFLVVESHTGAILKANHQALNMLDVPDNDLSNVSLQRVPEWLGFIREVVEQRSVWNRVLEISPDKTWALFSARYIQDNIIVIAQDVSAIQYQLQELEKVNIGLDNFVYHASHDLRAPLRSMQGLVTLLRTETSTQERDKFVNLIEGSLKRLDAFLVDLLSISRARRAQPRPLLKINFMVEIEKAISSFFHLEDHKNLEIITRISQPFAFMSDLTQVRVILNNILSNAIKYRRYGVRRSKIKVEIRVTKKQANIKITDNGLGIEPKHLSHIFEMFYRATDRGEGSGLGLYIVHETVEKLGGTVSFTSQPNRGTSFKIVLPNQYPDKSKG